MRENRMKDYNPTFVDLEDVPPRGLEKKKHWKDRFDEIPDGKAAMLRYHNRQTAHKASEAIQASARYWGVKIHTRVIHAVPEIHGMDGWLLYYWKPKEATE